MDIETIYRLYFRDVFLFLQGLTGSETLAEELTQETFFKALDGLKGFDGRQDVRAWLFTVARNAYYDHCRKARRTAPLEAAADAAADAPDVVQLLADETAAFTVHISACTRWTSRIKRYSACGCSASCPLKRSEPSLATTLPGPG